MDLGFVNSITASRIGNAFAKASERVGERKFTARTLNRISRDMRTYFPNISDSACSIKFAVSIRSFYSSLTSIPRIK